MNNKLLALLIISVIIIISVIVAYLIATSPACIKSHWQIDHHDAWMQMMPLYVGHTMTFYPVYHNAYDSNDTICDQYETKDSVRKS